MTWVFFVVFFFASGEGKKKFLEKGGKTGARQGRGGGSCQFLLEGSNEDARGRNAHGRSTNRKEKEKKQKTRQAAQRGPTVEKEERGIFNISASGH